MATRRLEIFLGIPGTCHCFIGKVRPDPKGGSLPETNSSPLKMDGWNTILSYWVSAYFQGRTVSFREGIPNQISKFGFERVVDLDYFSYFQDGKIRGCMLMARASDRK